MSTSLTPPEPSPRVTTVVWGTVLLIIAALVLAGQFFALSIDPVILTLGLLVGVGLSLVIGGILSLRSRHLSGADRDGADRDRSDPDHADWDRSYLDHSDPDRSDTGTDGSPGYWKG
ncbi:hypothetical protein [uncultured Arthrobacter sp.]|uniref:hypothetical protein n=1 Tax=uncultured Arthrobacter sp. TaxID=114050 RepID=UPI0026162514|nr:hypothetical protein [uncultured Arthrobacter sp.]